MAATNQKRTTKSNPSRTNTENSTKRNTRTTARTRTINKDTTKKSAAKGRTASQTGKGSSRKKNDPKGEQIDTAMIQEAILLAVSAVAIVLLLCNFGLCGKLGVMLSSLIFGLFGITAYIFPILLFFGVLFWVSNIGSGKAKIKLVSAVVVYLAVCAVMQQISFPYEKDTGLMVCYKFSAEKHQGGGWFGAFIGHILVPVFGGLGMYILMMALILAGVVLITEKSLIGGVKRHGKRVVQVAAEDTARLVKVNRVRREEKQQQQIRADKKVKGVTSAAFITLEENDPSLETKMPEENPYTEQMDHTKQMEMLHKEQMEYAGRIEMPYGNQTEYTDQIETPYGNQTEYADQMEIPYGNQTEYADQMEMSYENQMEYAGRIEMPYGNQTEYVDQIEMPYENQTKYADQIKMPYGNQAEYGDRIEIPYGNQMEMPYGNQTEYTDQIETPYVGQGEYMGQSEVPYENQTESMEQIQIPYGGEQMFHYEDVLLNPLETFDKVPKKKQPQDMTIYQNMVMDRGGSDIPPEMVPFSIYGMGSNHLMEEPQEAGWTAEYGREDRYYDDKTDKDNRTSFYANRKENNVRNDSNIESAKYHKEEQKKDSLNGWNYSVLSQEKREESLSKNGNLVEEEKQKSENSNLVERGKEKSENSNYIEEEKNLLEDTNLEEKRKNSAEDMNLADKRQDSQENINFIEKMEDFSENINFIEKRQDSPENMKFAEKGQDFPEDTNFVENWEDSLKNRDFASIKEVNPFASADEFDGFDHNQVSEQVQVESAMENSSQETETDGQENELAVEAIEPEVLPVEYVFPSLSLLRKGNQSSSDEQQKMENQLIASKLENTLRSFGVGVTVTDVTSGPAVTRYELLPDQGVKVSRIVGLADDIKLSLAAADIRIEAPIPGKSAVGIEVPNKEVATVMLRDLLESEAFLQHKSGLAFAVGKDIEGRTIVTDIAKMPHALIAGATGSGKSVCINTLIMSILYKAHPDDVKLIMVDPKVVELSVYNGIPHLLIPVVTDPKKAAGALNWAVAEMTDRYNKFSEWNVRNIQGYNEKAALIKEADTTETIQKMPQIVIIIDELADLMMVASNEVEEAICRLAQLARAAGIHLIIATQRPSVNVITGLIKANIPSRIAFAVSSGVDSRTILDTVGAEKLLGRGDMLFAPYGASSPIRIQGAFVSDSEVSNVVEFLKEQTEFVKQSTAATNRMISVITPDSGGDGTNFGKDDYFIEAGRLILQNEKASIGMLQRKFKIGFNRAARIMDQLAEAGVVGPEEGTKPRKVLMSLEEFEETF